MTKPQPRIDHYVADWAAANFKLMELTGGLHTTGVGNRYPLPFAAFYLDAQSGEGTGYALHRGDEGRGALVCYIYIGERPQATKE